VNFDGVNVNQLMTDAGETDAQIAGMLKGWLDLYGNSGKRSTINGSGHLGLAFGHLRVDLLQILGQALQIPDLAELNLRTAEADVRIVSGVVKVDKVVFLSQNLQLTGHGTIGADGKLALDARLTINGTISSRLPSFILSYFKPGDTGDSRHIDFAIGNTLAHPKTHLLDDITGHRIQGQMTDLFQSIFGKKRKEAEPAATPP
jgi:hypothetical protein